MAFTLPARSTIYSARSTNAVRSPMKAIATRRASVASRAAVEKSAFAKISGNVGMPTDEGVFGFTPFAEQWVGRWAMIGFAASIIGEFKTGMGALGQLGLETPSTPMLAVLLVLAGGATAYGTFATGKKAYDNKMTRTEVARYKNFLGLNSTLQSEEEAARMKAKGDFTTPGYDMAAINAAKAQGAPVDAFLSTNEVAQAEAAATAMKSEERTGEASTSEQAATSKATAAAAAAAMYYPGEASDIAYAKDVELTNGRWAMLGFLASIVVEAATGQGILGQVLLYCKLSGLLGDKSGF